MILLGSVAHPWGGPRVAFSQAAALPQGDGAELVLGRCTICHSLDAPSLPLQDHGGWTETVDRMIRWGAPLPAEEREIIVRYLVVHFGAADRP